MWLLVFSAVVFFVFPVGQVRATFYHVHCMTKAPASTEQMEEAVIPELDGLGEVAGGVKKLNKESLWRFVSGSSGKSIQPKRASAQHVGAVMAILGTLNEAGVLPPEADPRANQLIRSLIQFQSVFLKSDEPAVHAYFSSAIIRQWGEKAEDIRSSFFEKGWSSESLEALVEYSRHQSMWVPPGMQAAFQSYYLSPSDWALIQETFLEARERLVRQHQNIHTVFARQRQGMSGGDLSPH
jgi:hypothetical protein